MNSMKAFRHFCLVISALFFLLGATAPCQARMGLSETNFQTPGGHTICDCDNMVDYELYAPSILGFEQKIPRITDFYFYNNHIVGYSDSLFFIFDETTATLMTYTERMAWETARSERQLHPFLTRWLTIHDNPQDKLLIFLFLSYLLVPLSLVFVYFYVKIGFKAVKRERLHLRGTHTRIFIGLSLLLLWLLSELFWIESY